VCYCPHTHTMNRVRLPEQGSLQLAVITAVVSAIAFACLSIGGGCFDVVNAVWAFLGETQAVIRAGLGPF
jgi:hypothetical protein